MYQVSTMYFSGYYAINFRRKTSYEINKCAKVKTGLKAGFVYQVRKEYYKLKKNKDSAIFVVLCEHGCCRSVRELTYQKHFLNDRSDLLPSTVNNLFMVKVKQSNLKIDIFAWESHIFKAAVAFVLFRIKILTPWLFH